MRSEVWIKITENTFKSAKFEDIAFMLQIVSWHPYNSIEKAYFFIDSIDYETSENFSKLSQVQKKLVSERTSDAFTNGKNMHPKYVITSERTKQNNEFSLEEAIRFFLTPIFIVLENSLNDSYFLNAVFKHFGEKRENKNVLLEFLRNDWIQFVNAGGWTNIRNFIEGRKQVLQNRYRINPFLRAFILIDSDKQNANDDLSQNKQDLEKDMSQDGIQVHILTKRAMENYMPTDIVENLVKLVTNIHNNSFKGWLGSQAPKDWINNYKYTFSTEQKDYLDYQEGLEFPNYKTEFPKFFQYNHVTKATLLAREGGTEEDNEFSDILQKIYELL